MAEFWHHDEELRNDGFYRELAILKLQGPRFELAVALQLSLEWKRGNFCHHDRSRTK